MNVGPDSSTLQAQLQAQQQANTPVVRPARAQTPVQQTQNAGRDSTRSGLGDGSSQQAARQVRGQGVRSDVALSSDEELQSASENVNALLRREAPVGRLSQRAAAPENTALGQIIDIRV